MTNDEINEAVAKKLGWVQVPYYRDRFAWKRNGKGPCFKPRFHHPHIQSIWNSKGFLPDYCCDIRDAWQIVEHIQKKWIIHVMGGLNGKYWHCDMRDHPSINKVYVSESADTAPLAICLAFLKLPDTNSSHLTK